MLLGPGVVMFCGLQIRLYSVVWWGGGGGKLDWVAISSDLCVASRLDHFSVNPGLVDEVGDGFA